MTSEDKLREMLKEFDKGIIEVIRSLGEKYVAHSKILIGYKKNSINSDLVGLDRCIASANRAHASYCNLIGVPIKLESFFELQKIFTQDPADIEFNLKSAYLTTKKISIPNFPNFKMEKLVEAYDFSAQVLGLVKVVVENATDAFRPQSTFSSKWFDPQRCFDGKQFALDKSLESQIKEAHAVYMPLQQLDKVLMLHLLCESINELIEDPYSVRSLPEIDHRLLSYLVIPRDPAENRVELNLAKILEKSGLPPESQLVIGKRQAIMK